MRVVLYTDDMEPITVLELTSAALGYIKKNRVVELAVYERVRFDVSPCAPTPRTLRTVRIWSEGFVRNGVLHDIFFTRNDENALLLRASFLPGQIAGVQDKENTAFARGVLRALLALGGPDS